MNWLLALVLAGQLPTVQGPEPTRMANIQDAVSWTAQDLLLQPAADRPFLRYVWVPPWGDYDWVKAHSYLVNTVASQSAVIQLPDSAANGWLVRWDLRKLAPKDEELVNLLLVWDALGAREHYFHWELPSGIVSRTRRYRHIDGKFYEARRFVPSPVIDKQYRLLEEETLSFAPLVRADDFLERAGSTTDDGLYYHFAGFIVGGQRLTQDQIFRAVGLDVKESRDVEGDDRIGMFFSGVTAKARTIEMFQGALGPGYVTYDLFDQDNKAVERHPIYNLLSFPERPDLARGREVIFEKKNKLHGFLVTNGRGEIVDEADPKIVADHRIPEPFTRRLNAPLSCIRCHRGENGLRTPANDVKDLLGSGEIDVLDDVGDLRLGRREVIDRLAGLYLGDPNDSRILDGRVRYADAVFRSSAGLTVNQAGSKLSEIMEAYAYQLVTPRLAARELGYDCDSDAVARPLLKRLLARSVPDAIIEGHKVSLNDPSLAQLRAGRSITRSDWKRVFAQAAYLADYSEKRSLSAGSAKSVPRIEVVPQETDP